MIIIGEKINGSIPAVADAIARRDGEFIKERARIPAPDRKIPSASLCLLHTEVRLFFQYTSDNGSLLSFRDGSAISQSCLITVPIPQTTLVTFLLKEASFVHVLPTASR